MAGEFTDTLQPYRAAINLLQKELEAAVEKHRNIYSHHEALGVLLEEVRELENVVFQQSPMDTHREELASELLHVAAVAIRAIGDLELIELCADCGMEKSKCKCSESEIVKEVSRPGGVMLTFRIPKEI